jgi:hypothetical protein
MCFSFSSTSSDNDSHELKRERKRERERERKRGRWRKKRKSGRLDLSIDYLSFCVLWTREATSSTLADGCVMFVEEFSFLSNVLGSENN